MVLEIVLTFLIICLIKMNWSASVARAVLSLSQLSGRFVKLEQTHSLNHAHDSIGSWCGLKNGWSASVYSQLHTIPHFGSFPVCLSGSHCRWQIQFIQLVELPVNPSGQCVREQVWPIKACVFANCSNSSIWNWTIIFERFWKLSS